MRSLNTKCIILGHKNLGEYNKLIFLYSEDTGKIKAIAKGARKITSKFTGHLETLNICIVSLYFGPKNIILTEIISDENFEKIHTSLDKASGALQIADITNQLIPENEKLHNLIRLIEKTILHLAKTQKPTLIVTAYIIKLLDKIGLIPDFRETKGNLEEKYRKFFEFLKNRSLSEIEKISLNQKEKIKIKQTLKRIIEHETDKKFKSLLFD